MNVLTRLIAVTFLSLVFLSGCAKNADSSKEAMEDAQSADSTETMTAEEESVLVEMGLDESSQDGQMSLLEQMTVYFDYDESTVTEQAQNIIRAHAEALVQNPDAALHLAGHADERGTREYNLALGEQRALAVSAFFQEFGVEASRITTVSFGEEMPAVGGSDEDSWALNRRVEISHDLAQ